MLPELGEQWMDFIDRAASVAAAAYLAASHEMLRHVRVLLGSRSPPTPTVSLPRGCYTVHRLAPWSGART